LIFTHKYAIICQPFETGYEIRERRYTTMAKNKGLWWNPLHNFIPQSVRLQDHPNKGVNAKLVYQNLLSHADKDTGIAFPSQEQIAKETGISISSVRRAIKQLVKHGLVVVTRRRDPKGKWLHNVYHLTPIRERGGTLERIALYHMGELTTIDLEALEAQVSTDDPGKPDTRLWTVEALEASERGKVISDPEVTDTDKLHYNYSKKELSIVESYQCCRYCNGKLNTTGEYLKGYCETCEDQGKHLKDSKTMETNQKPTEREKAYEGHDQLCIECERVIYGDRDIGWETDDGRLVCKDCTPF
jgi:biotin operon repressor